MCFYSNFIINGFTIITEWLVASLSWGIKVDRLFLIMQKELKGGALFLVFPGIFYVTGS
jgi:hypothetical protein